MSYLYFPVHPKSQQSGNNKETPSADEEYDTMI